MECIAVSVSYVTDHFSSINKSAPLFIGPDIPAIVSQFCITLRHSATSLLEQRGTDFHIEDGRCSL